MWQGEETIPSYAILLLKLSTGLMLVLFMHFVLITVLLSFIVLLFQVDLVLQMQFTLSFDIDSACFIFDCRLRVIDFVGKTYATLSRHLLMCLGKSGN